MLRGLLVIVCIAILAAAIVFGPRYLGLGDEPATTSAKVCDLDVKSCQWGNGPDAWSLDLQRTGPAPTDTLRLELRAPASAAGDERMIAVLEGQSMYMGQYPVALQRGAPNDGHIRFSAQFQAPLCTVDPDMVWKLTLKRGTDTLDLPVVPTFQTRHPDAR